MLFVIIRLAFWSIAFIISFILIKRSQIVNKQKWSIIAFVVAVILTTISALIPIENALITFSTPETAYNYNNFGDVKLVVDGEKSDFVVGVKDNTDFYATIPKVNDGWKIGMASDTRSITQTVSDGIVIYVYQYRNTNDYYITVLDTKGGSTEIKDSHNSEFKYLKKSNNKLNKTFYTYYAYINAFDNQYELTVNGNTIKI